MSNAGIGGRTHLMFEFTSDLTEERGIKSRSDQIFSFSQNFLGKCSDFTSGTRRAFSWKVED